MLGNTFGRLFRITTCGESYGGGLAVIVDGVPAGLSLTEEYIQHELNKRRPGQSEIDSPRKETDIVVGNVIGSNIFNLLFIGGVVPLIRPIPTGASLFYVEFPFLLLLSILVFPIMRTRWKVFRWEGIFLVICYVIFVGLTFRS